MAGKKRKGNRKRKAPLVFRSGQVCEMLTKRGAGGRRKRIVECRPLERGETKTEVRAEFEPHCSSKACSCGVSYQNFRSGWSFAEAAEMLGARGGAKYRPSRGRILSLMGRLKRDEWLRHQQACSAGSSGPAEDPFDDAFYAENFNPDVDPFAGVRGRRRRRAQPVRWR